ncbi:hypothetical protein, conserved [Trypanosoma brucei gambiense DAL972]|uniref:Uncharacterized protein n=1 Tax=Trypanosoma brucei gambiense (strain MHOM/CI/86/DAL972) TaxID=679716 RepID=C9ZYB1_TRYB9|nr:hypothetical protein, conserved [Trypanosoma brucei gambiense DAL972]CBH14410.1 hypothetical protein, conserved [Trypanosoma brucei gambiense DAL972]|eukprot:XP_011776676.1 hypothetical protein, conserved [Trypanosoma brucei gambiense DAL972]
MNVVALSPSAAMCMGTGKKPGRTRIIDCFRKQGEELYVLFLDEKVAELRFWREKKGVVALHGAGKYVTRVVDAACDSLYTIVFFHHDKGRQLGLAMMEHSVPKPTHLVGSPKDYSEDFETIVAPLLPADDKGKRFTSQLHIHRSCLKQTTSGLVVVALLTAPMGDMHVIIGSLEGKLWRRFRLEEAFGVPNCICIQSERVVSVARCSVGSPASVTSAVSAPTVELALSVFDQTYMDGDSSNKKTVHGGGPPRSAAAPFCVTMQEIIFSLNDRDATLHTRYQSQIFRVPEGEVSDYAHPRCQLYVDKQQLRYAAFVSVGGHSYVTHLRRSPLNMDMMASCTRLSISGIPRGVMWLSLPHPTGQESGSVDLVVLLSQDYRLYASEMFGGAFAVFADDNRTNNTVPFCLPSKLRGDTSLYSEGFACATHLLQVSKSEFVCTNGILSVGLRVTGLSVGEDIPRDVFSFLSSGEGGPERRAVSLARCLQFIDELAEEDEIGVLQAVFQKLLPMLQCAGSTQSEAFLVQRVFQGILAAAPPQEVEDWRLLWNVALLVQKMLAKRGRDNTVVYTDHFFISLLDCYAQCQGTEEEKERATERLLSVVSDELKLTWKSFARKLDDEVLFVLDNLAERIALPLAEECVRRMVSVTIMSDGTHVVSARANTSHIIHALGVVLLASCLDVDVFVDINEVGQLRCCTSRTASTAVLVSPSVTNESELFDYTLALSADLLCVSAPDTQQTPPCAAALLAMLSARRYHAMFTFVQVFALPMTQQMVELGSLNDNTSLLADCAASVSLTEAELFRRILSGTTPSHIMQVLCNGSVNDDNFNTSLWQCMGDVLSGELRALIIAAVLHAMTDRVIAAQNNYSASVMAALLLDEVKDPLRDVSVGTCRERLRILLLKLEKLWAAVEVWSPYKVGDVAACLVSANAAQHDAGSGFMQASSGGSVVSRTFVLCFRLLGLVSFSYQSEDKVTELLQDLEDASSVVHACKELLHIINGLKGTSLPVEALQWRCVDVAKKSVETCTRNCGLATLLLEMLELSGVRSTTVASLSRYQHGVVDSLTKIQQSDGEGPHCQRPLEPLGRYEVATARSGNMKGTDYFIWSRGGGADVPDWPGSHDLESRRRLVNTDWVDAVWPLERTVEAHTECVEHTRKRIFSCCDSGSEPADELSPQLGAALFQQLCTISPPVRVHALMPSKTTEPVLQGPPSKESLSDAPAAIRSPASVAQPALPAASAEPLTPQKLTPQNEERLITDLSTASSLSRQTRVEVKPSSSQLYAAAPVRSTVPALFTPDYVAWWEADGAANVDAGSRPSSRAVRQDLNTLAESNTSYTTLTTEPSARHVDVDERSILNTRHSHHRCKRHSGQRYRCAKHRTCDICGSRGVSPSVYHAVLPRKRLVYPLNPSADEGGRAIRLLKFESTLEPPPLPSSMADSFPKQTAGRRLDLEDGRIRAPPQLLSLRSKPRVPHVTLFALGKINTACDQTLDNVSSSRRLAGLPQFSAPSASLAAPQSLLPPPVPPSDVFVRPPSLLTLHVPTAVSASPSPSVVNGKRVQCVVSSCTQEHEDKRIMDDEMLVPETTLFATESAEGPKVSAVTTGQIMELPTQGPTVAAPSSGVPPPLHNVADSANALPGKEVMVGLAGTTPVGTGDVAPSPAPLPTSVSKQAILTPSEAVAFNRYVDEIKMRGPGALGTSAGAVLVPVPVTVTANMAVPECVPAPAPMHPSAPASSLGQAPSTTAGGAMCVPLGVPSTEVKRDNEILDVVREMLVKHEEIQATNFQALMEAVRSKPQEFSSYPRAEVASDERSQVGLSAIEQAQLLRHTIQQKDRLLEMNQELLDIHSRAQLLAAAAPVVQAPRYTAMCVGQPVKVENDTMPLQPAPPPVVTLPLQSDTVSAQEKRAVESPAITQTDPSSGAKENEDSVARSFPAPIGTVSASTYPVSRGIPSTQTMDLTFSSLNQMNAELLRANTTAEDMERAIQQSRTLLQKQSSLQFAHASAVEGSAMLDVARSRTAALEQQLITLNAPSFWRIESTQRNDEQPTCREQPSVCTNASSTAEGYITDEVNGTTSGSPSPTRFRFTNETTTEAEWLGSGQQRGSLVTRPSPQKQYQQTAEYTFDAQAGSDLAPSASPLAVSGSPVSVLTVVPTREVYPSDVPTWHEHKRAGAVSHTVATPLLALDSCLLQCQPRKSSTVPSVVADLSQLYGSAPSRPSEKPKSKSVSPAKRRVGIASGRPTNKPVPERFNMYAAVTAIKKTPNRRTASAKRTITPTNRPPWLGTGPAPASSGHVLKAGGANARYSRRERERLDTLALHTSKRLAELQKALS